MGWEGGRGAREGVPLLPLPPPLLTWYCLRSAFRGVVITCVICSRVRAASFARTGKRPTNSGKNP